MKLRNSITGNGTSCIGKRTSRLYGQLFTRAIGFRKFIILATYLSAIWYRTRKENNCLLAHSPYNRGSASSPCLNSVYLCTSAPLRIAVFITYRIPEKHSSHLLVQEHFFHTFSLFSQLQDVHQATRQIIFLVCVRHNILPVCFSKNSIPHSSRFNCALEIA